MGPQLLGSNFVGIEIGGEVGGVQVWDGFGMGGPDVAVAHVFADDGAVFGSHQSVVVAVAGTAFGLLDEHYPQAAANLNRILQSLIALLARLKVPSLCTATHELGVRSLFSQHRRWFPSSGAEGERLKATGPRRSRLTSMTPATC